MNIYMIRSIFLASNDQTIRYEEIINPEFLESFFVMMGHKDNFTVMTILALASCNIFFGSNPYFYSWLLKNEIYVETLLTLIEWVCDAVTFLCLTFFNLNFQG